MNLKIDNQSQAVDTAKAENKMEVRNVNFYYGKFQALSMINMTIAAGKITAIIGPSGCGKSTLLRCFNRMNDLVDNVRVEGTILLDGEDLNAAGVDVVDVRRRVGMVFQRPNPFPKSIYDNVAYGPRLYGIRRKNDLDEIVEKSIKQAALWDEVKDKLHQSGLSLSGGQQQRLCIARALAVEPDNVKALLLAGTAAFNRNDYAGAVRHWERAQGAVPQESEMAQSLRASIAEAQTLGGGSTRAPAEPVKAAGAAQVKGVVKIAPGLAAKVGPDDTLFIFARAEKGPRMPLAILRRSCACGDATSRRNSPSTTPWR